MDAISLPVVHPASEKLKRSGSWLHIVAGLLILTHAISHLYTQESLSLSFWCPLIISLDIFILVFAGGDMLSQLPNVNLFFRVVEILFFLGIGLLMLLAGKGIAAVLHLSLSIGYSYLFYYEKGFRQEELLSFHHIGITMPGLPERKFLHWVHINEIKAFYDSIHISTSGDEHLTFDLRRNLDFEEMEHIHAFCQFYLGKA